MANDDMTLKEIDTKIKACEVSIKALQDIRTVISGLSEAQRLAIFLHKKFCHHNHTDGCDWHYGSWSSAKNNHARKIYLEKAEKLIATGIDIQTITNIAELI